MRFCILFAAIFVEAFAAPKRAKREAYELPDGVDILVGPVKTSFSCFNDGYYADVDNNCKIFHVCHSAVKEDGSQDTKQWSFLCGNQTLFNQLTFTCADPEDAVPCPEAPSFYSINDRINAGDIKLYFLNDDDIERAAPLLSRNKGGIVNEVRPPAGGGVVNELRPTAGRGGLDTYDLKLRLRKPVRGG